MSQDKVTKFGPGQEFRLNTRVIFVEYESMTGELVKCWFHLSQRTEMILNDCQTLSFDDLRYLCSKGEEIFIKKVEYYEEECHLVIGDKLLIPTKVYFENIGYQQEYETHNKLSLRNVANSVYGIASRDWNDVLADDLELTAATKLSIKKITFNGPATIVMWSDGTKTIVKCREGDEYDGEKGIFAACAKKLLGTNKTGSNYLDKIYRAVEEEESK